MGDERRFLDPQFISKIKNVSLVAKLVVEGFLIGLHRSPYHGFSIEFAQHRQYTKGDDLKYLDWKVFARTDRFHVKQFEEETNMRSYILVDSSASMGYSCDGITKLEYACYLAASLSYLMLRQRDQVGVATFNSSAIQYLPPRSKAGHLHNILLHIDNARPEGKTNVSGTLHRLAEMIIRRGLIILISDLWDDQEEVLKGLAHFRHKKHEVIVFNLLSREERQFPFEGMYSFRDMEEGNNIITRPETIRKEYLDRLSQFINKYKFECGKNGIDFVPIDTSTHFDQPLFKYLKKRERVK